MFHLCLNSYLIDEVNLLTEVKCNYPSVFRALGIPTRCVTGFKAAHDGDFGSAVDAHWTTDGKPRKTLDDSVW